MRTKTKKVRPPFKSHGGKYYLSDFIISHFPENYEEMHYLEPFCSGASVLFAKEASKEECISDLDKGIIAIHRSIRDQCDAFLAKLKKIKYTRETFERALTTKPVAELDYAVNEFILRRMSRGGLKTAFAWSERKRGGKPGDENAWDTMKLSLPALSKRLQSVIILNTPAQELIKLYSMQDTLLYVDPPYLPDTRVSKSAYDSEMTTQQHIELASALTKFRGKAILSGYPSTLYNKLYKGWRCVKKTVKNHASQSKTKPVKTEVLWLNF